VPERRSKRTRVMLANLDPIVRLGLAKALADDGIDVVGDEHDDDGAVLTAGQALPDAIVLGSDDERSVALGERLRLAAPDTKLIFFARDENGSNVLEARSTSPRRIPAPVAETLLAELSEARPKPEERHA
jgi:DNA-binding NarL/FixJ family response regulator